MNILIKLLSIIIGLIKTRFRVLIIERTTDLIIQVICEIKDAIKERRAKKSDPPVKDC